jgi:hypothetical protein
MISLLRRVGSHMSCVTFQCMWTCATRTLHTQPPLHRPLPLLQNRCHRTVNYVFALASGLWVLRPEVRAAGCSKGSRGSVPTRIPTSSLMFSCLPMNASIVLSSLSPF